MGDVTEHFSVLEFNCKDGTVYPIAWIEKRLRPLCDALEKIRALTNQPLKVHSGYRTPNYNKLIYKRIGKKPTKSKHCDGIAADIELGGMTQKQLYDAILNLIKQHVIPNGGLGLYEGFIHYDQRCTFDNSPPARWVG